MRKKLDLGSLQVTSFSTGGLAAAQAIDTYEFCKCCTGCDSGCGIVYTAGCEDSGTGGGDTEAPAC